MADTPDPIQPGITPFTGAAAKINILLKMAEVLGVTSEDDTPPEVREKLLGVLGLTPADVAGLASALDEKLGSSGTAVAEALDNLFGNDEWRPRAAQNWVMIVGKVGSTYGYRTDFQGAFIDTTIIAGRTIDAFLAISPNIIRFRTDDNDGNDAPVTGAEALNVTMRDLAGNAVNATLLWDENSAHYQGLSSEAYTWLAAREGATVTLTGLNTAYGVSALGIAGTVPTSMTVGNIYSTTIDAVGGKEPYVFSLIGDWPAGLVLDSATGALVGAPTVDGSFTGLSVRVTDDEGETADLATFTITVATATALSITGTPTTTATQGTAYVGFGVTATGGNAPYTYSLVGTWPANLAIGPQGNVGGTPGNSGSFTNLSVRVTDAGGATADLDEFTITVTAEGSDYLGADVRTGNLVSPEHAIGDWLITIAFRTGNHGGVAPALTNIDENNPWEPWGEPLIEGTDRAARAYKLKATRTDHTAVWENTAGYKGIWGYHGKEPDVIKLVSYATGTSITIPEL